MTIERVIVLWHYLGRNGKKRARVYLEKVNFWGTCPKDIGESFLSLLCFLIAMRQTVLFCHILNTLVFGITLDLKD